MLYRRFGKTELKLPVISMGGMRFPKGGEQPHDEIPEATLKKAVELVEYCMSKGINHFETARGYGKSERIYGKVLQILNIPRQDYIITTKIGPTDTRQEMEKYIAESLEFLGLDYIDNFDIHGINDRNDFENTIKKGGCLSAVEDAIAKGLIRHLGFSTHAPLPVILDVINTDIFESVNLHYYFIHQSNRAAVDLAAHKDMGVFIISPSEKGGMLFKPSAKMKKLCEPYTPVEMNDRWLLSNPAVCTISCGASEPEHIDQHLGAILSGPIPNDTDRCIFARLESEKARTRDFCIECRKCLPCPEGIPIPMVLRMRNAREAFDLTEYASWRYNMMNPGDKWLGGTKGDKCTECGDCVPRCPVELNIPKLLKDFHKECSRMTE